MGHILTEIEKAHWVAFTKVRGIGPVRFERLHNYFGSAHIAWNASTFQLEKAGLGEKIIQAMTECRSKIDVMQLYDSIVKNGIKVISSAELEYPKRLLEINYPPFILFLRGILKEEDQKAVAVVGTRQKTSYGRQIAIDLCDFLVGNNITIISGMARGVDSIAHQAALDAGGRTLAVLGCGVDIIYPPENRKLMDLIIENGAIISEYSPGTQPDAVNFPPRNRIISGLSLATVIIEAGVKSGALITAAFAADQGREVFAVPGAIYSPRSKGTNRLIQDGARPLINFDEILEVLNIYKLDSYSRAQKTFPANDTEEIIIHSLSNEPMHIDDIQSQTGIPIEKVSASLVMLELKGMVRQVSNMTYSAIQEEEENYG